MEPLERHFGLVIAYLLPGFTCLYGFGSNSPTLALWIAAEPTRAPSLGGFLYVLLGSLAVGLIVSAVRWVIIDRLHHSTGIPQPQLDYGRLNDNLSAYQLAVEHNYRYFQFYANMAVAILLFAFYRQATQGLWSFSSNAGIVILEAILLAASRDCLNRFYERLRLVLGTSLESAE